MILPLLLIAAAQATPGKSAQVPPPATGLLEDRYNSCVDRATRAPADAQNEANRWLLEGGGFLAHQCLGIAYSNAGRWSAAATEFELAARSAETGHDDRSAYYWAQAGNAWLAAQDADRARADLDAAIAPQILVGLQRSEAFLDRARAFVAGGDMPAARADLDRALADSERDPLAWLLSATLARRMGDLPRAQKDIAEALKRASNDASVQLEAGNIAATAGDEGAAKAAWGAAAKLQPGSPANKSAIAALAQFDTPSKP